MIEKKENAVSFSIQRRKGEEIRLLSKLVVFIISGTSLMKRDFP